MSYGSNMVRKSIRAKCVTVSISEYTPSTLSNSNSKNNNNIVDFDIFMDFVFWTSLKIRLHIVIIKRPQFIHPMGNCGVLAYCILYIYKYVIKTNAYCIYASSNIHTLHIFSECICAGEKRVSGMNSIGKK